MSFNATYIDPETTWQSARSRASKMADLLRKTVRMNSEF
jgi:hypothetical protein